MLTVVIAAPTIHSMNRTKSPISSPPNVDMNVFSWRLWILTILIKGQLRGSKERYMVDLQEWCPEHGKNRSSKQFCDDGI